jgi:hypothetical protein
MTGPDQSKITPISNDQDERKPKICPFSPRAAVVQADPRGVGSKLSLPGQVPIATVVTAAPCFKDQCDTWDDINKICFFASACRVVALGGIRE